MLVKMIASTIEFLFSVTFLKKPLFCLNVCLALYTNPVARNTDHSHNLLYSELQFLFYSRKSYPTNVHC